MKAHEVNDYTSNLKELDYELSRACIKVNELNKTLEQKNQDARLGENMILERENELMRMRDTNGLLMHEKEDLTRRAEY